MANPTGHTYHYGEHKPLAEPGAPRGLYREETLGGSQEAWRWEGEGTRAGFRRAVSRYPVAAALAALAAGALGGWLLSSRA